MELKTILLLDDDPQFHDLIVPVLTDRGHRVISAHSGAEGRRVVEKEKIDLAIVDGHLPDITGIDWIANLRRSGNGATLMFVSGYWRDASTYHKLTKELGVALVLHKPVMASVFAAEVDIMFEHQQGSTSSADEIKDIEDTLLSFRAEYAKELPLRFQEISQSLSQLKEHPGNMFLKEEARLHCHKLHGTAASYGFPAVGELAGQLEDALLKMQTLTGKQRTAVWTKIEKSLVKLDGEIDSAAREGQKISATSPRSTRFRPTAPPAVARMLVVDDDEAFLDVVEDLGQSQMIEVVRASNAQEALDRACMRPVDAALIDVDLKERETAFRLAGDLRTLPGYSSLPLAFISGSGHIEETIEVEAVGQCLYFDKDSGKDALKAAFQQLVAIRQVTRPRVLLIDDDVEFARRMAFVLGYEGLDVKVLDKTEDILDQMLQFNPDLVLLDVLMPGVSGFDICRMLRTMPRWQDVPVLFMSANTDLETRLACYECGGDDFLGKPMVNEELLIRIRIRLERARLLKVRVDKDSVTGLLLRRPFMEHLAGMISEAQRHGWSVTLCLIRVNNYASACQEFGHAITDGALSSLGSMLHKRLRAEDLKARWSDDEFILGFRSETASIVSQMIRRLIEEFSNREFKGDEGVVFRLTLSGGIARYPGDGNTIHELLGVADRRVQEARLAEQAKVVSTG
jgi:diguanylate cyclase (GGDEF)-like protein